jgi:predicted anti-sigma-YlaC factor YlaD
MTMSEDLHRRAERLMIESRMGQTLEPELWWLDAHLEQCKRCAALAQATERAVQSLRAIPVSVPPDLLRTTQARVHRRASELARRQETAILAWLGAVVSLAWVGLSGLYVWRGLRWAAVKFGIPSPIWQMAFGLWWFIPAIIVAAALSTLRPGGFGRYEVEGPIFRRQDM